jgi:hypothetical protein
MPQVIIDFKKRQQFIPENVLESGIYIGKKIYWKLYAIENFYRIIIHSILSVQVDPEWWPVVTPPRIQKKAQKFKNDYVEKPWYTMPGKHFIYFTDLYGLNEITRINSGFFEPIIPTIDDWVLKIEDMRLPRNVVAHMNFPNKTDRQRISIFYEDFKKLIKSIQDKGKIILKVPK